MEFFYGAGAMFLFLVFVGAIWYWQEERHHLMALEKARREGRSQARATYSERLFFKSDGAAILW